MVPQGVLRLMATVRSCFSAGQDKGQMFLVRGGGLFVVGSLAFAACCAAWDDLWLMCSFQRWVGDHCGSRISMVGRDFFLQNHFWKCPSTSNSSNINILLQNLKTQSRSDITVPSQPCGSDHVHYTCPVASSNPSTGEPPLLGPVTCTQRGSSLSSLGEGRKAPKRNQLEPQS